MRSIVLSALNDVSDDTLKAGPPRLLAFLQGVADPAIRALFAPLGWSDERVEEAWALLSELRAVNHLPSAGAPDPTVEAIATCEAWQATGLIRARAMLQLSAPEQATYLFQDFEAGKGTSAVLNVATFLERRQVLASGAERKGSRKADHEALGVLEETGCNKEVVAQLQAAVETVQSVAPQSPLAAEADTRRTEVLRRIHAWITAWSEMARTVITRRDQMIRLGLAKRRPRKGKSAVVAPSPVAAPAPVAPAPVKPSAPAPVAPVVAMPTLPTPVKPVVPAAVTPADVASPAAIAPPAVPPVIVPPATPSIARLAPPAPATSPSLDEHDTGPQSRAA
jgi:hypothetical protein